MSANEDFFTFGTNDGHIGTRTKPWKAVDGTSYRVSFAWFPLNSDGTPDMRGNPQFTGKNTNYIQGAGYVINQGAEWTKLAGEAPRQRIATILVIWPTNKSGAVDASRLNDFEVKPWIISSEKYKNLDSNNREFPFSQHDLTIKCEEGGGQFQKLAFLPCKENLIRTLISKSVEPEDKTNEKAMASAHAAKAMVNRIVEEVASVASSIQDHVGRVMSIQQIREKMTGNGAPGQGPAAGGNFQASAGDISSIVGGLLDD